jgi:hypothetical protein
VCGDYKQEEVYDLLNNLDPEEMEYFNQRIDECRSMRKRLEQDLKDFPMGTVITFRTRTLFAWFPKDRKDDEKEKIMIFDYDELVDISERYGDDSNDAVYLDD